MPLQDIVAWTERHGDERALARLKMCALGHLLREKIDLTALTPTTTCSPECLRALREGAELIVGRPCPH